MYVRKSFQILWILTQELEERQTIQIWRKIIGTGYSTILQNPKLYLMITFFIIHCRLFWTYVFLLYPSMATTVRLSLSLGKNYGKNKKAKKMAHVINFGHFTK